MKRNRRAIRVGIVGAVVATLVSLTSVAEASSTLDQSAPVDLNGSYALRSIQSIGQSFTAGVTGALTSISVNVDAGAATANITSKLYAADPSGFPTGAVLATATVDSSSVSGNSPFNLSIPFDSAPHIVAGTSYAFTLESTASGNWYSVRSASAAYAAGHGFWCDPSACTWSNLGGPNELGFATYVDTSVPSDLTLWQKAYARSSAAEVCQSGWNPSWMEWPNAHKGGYVCVRNTYAYYPDAPYVG